MQPRPQLPPSVRSSLIQNMDWMLVAVIAASFVLHVGFVMYLRNSDWPRKPDIEEIPDRFVQMIVPKKVEEPSLSSRRRKTTRRKTRRGQEEGLGRGQQAEGAAQEVRDLEREARAAAERRARLAADVQKMGVLKILGSKGDNGAVADLVKGGDVSGDADKVFAQVGGVGVAGAGAGGLRSAKGAGGSGTLRGGGSLRASGPGEVGTGERQGERAVKGIVKDSAPTDGRRHARPGRHRQGDPRPPRRHQGLLRSGAQAQPEHRRQSAAALRGVVGRKVTSAEIENDTMHDEEVASCIKARRLVVALSGAGAGSVQFSYPFIFQASK